MFFIEAFDVQKGEELGIRFYEGENIRKFTHFHVINLDTLQTSVVTLDVLLKNLAKNLKNFINIDKDGKDYYFENEMYFTEYTNLFKPSNKFVDFGTNFKIRLNYGMLRGGVYDTKPEAQIFSIQTSSGEFVDFGKGSANHKIVVNNKVVRDFDDRNDWRYFGKVKGHITYTINMIGLSNNIFSLCMLYQGSADMSDNVNQEFNVWDNDSPGLNIYFNIATGKLVDIEV